jgi:phosphinothricin acetyltransferase
MSAAIRLATANDGEQLSRIYAPIVRDTAISFEIDPPDAAEMARRIVETLPALPWLVADSGGEVLGYVYASRHRARAAYSWSVDTTVYIHAGARRTGVGRALYASLFSILTLQRFYSAYAGISLPNPGSVGLHEAVGFEKVGVYRRVSYKLGAWHDAGWWQREIQPRPAVPALPADMATVWALPAWDAALASGLALLRV